MTGFTKLIACTMAACTIVSATASLAQDKNQRDAAAARLANMNLQAFNLGIIGRMAQGRTDYDAATAKAAADNLAALAQGDWSIYFPQGTSADEIESSRAEPAIWQNWDDFNANKQIFVEAADTMAAAASTDLDSLRGAMVGLTEACGGCHRDYRRIPN